MGLIIADTNIIIYAIKGLILKIPDALIAATAIHYDTPLLTAIKVSKKSKNLKSSL